MKSWGRWWPGTALALSLAILTACAPTRADQADVAAEKGPTIVPNPVDHGRLTAGVLGAYEAYLSVLVEALAAGDPETAAFDGLVTGAALERTRQALRANLEEDVRAEGTVLPAATTADVQIDGERARLSDCVRNDLARVSASDPETVVVEPRRIRQPLTVTFEREDEGWMIVDLEGPPLRGPATEEAEVCAPTGLERDILAAYEAHWDAVYAAADPGDGKPPDPGHPDLASTIGEPQLGHWQAMLTEWRDRGYVMRGRPETDPQVRGVFDGDRMAVVFDCVTEVEGAGVYELDSGRLIEAPEPGAGTQDTTELRFEDGRWKVTNWDIVEASPCEQH